jgi:hypothetical protein
MFIYVFKAQMKEIINGIAEILHIIICIICGPVLFVCICVLNNCYRVATQLQLNIYHMAVSPKLTTHPTTWMNAISFEQYSWSSRRHVAPLRYNAMFDAKTVDCMVRPGLLGFAPERRIQNSLCSCEHCAQGRMRDEQEESWQMFASERSRVGVWGLMEQISVGRVLR